MYFFPTKIRIFTFSKIITLWKALEERWNLMGLPK